MALVPPSSSSSSDKGALKKKTADGTLLKLKPIYPTKFARYTLLALGNPKSTLGFDIVRLENKAIKQKQSPARIKVIWMELSMLGGDDGFYIARLPRKPEERKTRRILQTRIMDRVECYVPESTSKSKQIAQYHIEKQEYERLRRVADGTIHSTLWKSKYVPADAAQMQKDEESASKVVEGEEEEDDDDDDEDGEEEVNSNKKKKDEKEAREGEDKEEYDEEEENEEGEVKEKQVKDKGVKEKEVKEILQESEEEEEDATKQKRRQSSPAIKVHIPASSSSTPSPPSVLWVAFKSDDDAVLHIGCVLGRKNVDDLQQKRPAEVVSVQVTKDRVLYLPAKAQVLQLRPSEVSYVKVDLVADRHYEISQEELQCLEKGESLTTKSVNLAEVIVAEPREQYLENIVIQRLLDSAPDQQQQQKKKPPTWVVFGAESHIGLLSSPSVLSSSPSQWYRVIVVDKRRKKPGSDLWLLFVDPEKGGLRSFKLLKTEMMDFVDVLGSDTEGYGVRQEELDRLVEVRTGKAASSMWHQVSSTWSTNKGIMEMPPECFPPFEDTSSTLKCLLKWAKGSPRDHSSLPVEIPFPPKKSLLSPAPPPKPTPKSTPTATTKRSINGEEKTTLKKPRPSVITTAAAPTNWVAWATEKGHHIGYVLRRNSNNVDGSYLVIPVTMRLLEQRKSYHLLYVEQDATFINSVPWHQLRPDQVMDTVKVEEEVSNDVFYYVREEELQRLAKVRTGKVASHLWQGKMTFQWPTDIQNFLPDSSLHFDNDPIFQSLLRAASSSEDTITTMRSPAPTPTPTTPTPTYKPLPPPPPTKRKANDDESSSSSIKKPAASAAEAEEKERAAKENEQAERVTRAAKEKADKEREAKEKGDKERELKLKADKETEIKAKAEKEREAKEREAKQKADKEREAKEKRAAEEREAKEKRAAQEREAKEREAKQQAEKERELKLKADKEREAKERGKKEAEKALAKEREAEQKEAEKALARERQQAQQAAEDALAKERAAQQKAAEEALRKRAPTPSSTKWDPQADLLPVTYASLSWVAWADPSRYLGVNIGRFIRAQPPFSFVLKTDMKPGPDGTYHILYVPDSFLMICLPSSFLMDAVDIRDLSGVFTITTEEFERLSAVLGGDAPSRLWSKTAPSAFYWPRFDAHMPQEDNNNSMGILKSLRAAAPPPPIATARAQPYERLLPRTFYPVEVWWKGRSKVFALKGDELVASEVLSIACHKYGLDAAKHELGISTGTTTCTLPDDLVVRDLWRSDDGPNSSRVSHHQPHTDLLHVSLHLMSLDE